MPHGRPPLPPVRRDPYPDELTFLLDLAQAARTRPAGEVLDLACTSLARLLTLQVSAYLPEASRDGLTPVVARNADGGTDEAGCLNENGCVDENGEWAALAAEVVAKARPVHRLVPAPRAAAAPGHGPALAVPLGRRGALIAAGSAAAAIPPVHQRLLDEVGVVLGRLMDAERQQSAEVEKPSASVALRQLLEAGVRACSRMEAAQALAGSTATMLGVSTACAYLVDDSGLISEVATFGAAPGRDARLRDRLVGAPASGSPVWRRAAAGLQPGPDLIADTTVPGVVRPGGVAEVLGLRSMATIPLLSSEGVLGLVLCGDAGEPRSWRDEDRDLLAQLALQGTVIVDNARLRESERLEARYDVLTGLANRRFFTDTIKRVLGSATLTRRRVGILQIDLDRFQEVNDQLGHQQGDALLVEVARRLALELDDVALLARFGGDEFAVLLDDVDTCQAEAVAARVAGVLDRPVRLADQDVTVEASVGIAVFPDHGADADTLLQRADRAMHAAKRTGFGCLVYRSEHDARLPVEPGLLGELRRAIAEDQLVLHYQPKIDLRSGRIRGVEALVRWAHPRLGLLYPDRFVPLAEQSGRIRSLTGWVLPHALEQARRWRDSGLPLSVAVNVSPRDIADPRFPVLVEKWLADADLPGAFLTIEVTEGTLMTDPERASVVLRELQAIDVRISLDDFGTGYSSLAYLHSLPVDEIKIDRSFLGASLRRHSVIRSMLTLGRDLGLRTVTEGVEDPATASALTALGSDEAQGYYFGRPCDAEQLEALVRHRTRRGPSS